MTAFIHKGEHQFNSRLFSSDLNASNNVILFNQKENKKTVAEFKDAEVEVGLTFSSEVQMIFDPPLPLFQLLGQLSVLPAWTHTHTVTTCANTN